MISISVVMPAYNEEGIIEKSVRDYYDEIVKKIPDSEFIVVDDWSTDNTPIILKNLQIELPKLIVVKTPSNSGHGKALRLGLETAKKDFVFHTDSDYQHDPKEFWKLYSYIDQFDFVTGYRINRKDAFHRRIISRMVRIINSILFGIKLRDTNCPFRIYRRETLKKTLKWVDKEAFIPSILILIVASCLGIRIKEIAVTHYQRKTGKVSIKGLRLLRICLRSFKEVINLRKNIIKHKLTKLTKK